MARVAFLHYRVGKTDGVSLQIESWTEILKQKGWQVVWCSGPVNEGADFTVPGLELQLDEEVRELNNAAYSGEMSEEEFTRRFNQQKEKLKDEFRQMFQAVKPDVLWVSNIFAVGEHLAATAALSEVLKELPVKVVAVHHDFYWEAVRYKKPAYRLVEEVFEQYFPPRNLRMKHACINTIAVEELKKRKGIEAVVFPDALDFDYIGDDGEGNCRRALEGKGMAGDELVIIQGTRIVRRKNIELAIDFARELQGRLEEVHKQKLVLVLAGYAEKRDEGYREQLLDYAKEVEVRVVAMPEVVSGGKKQPEACSLYDVYRYADLISYPSEYEGFGNQFLEAVRAKKPVVMFEYPVFVRDIKPLGFEVVSLGRELQRGKDGLVKVLQVKLKEAVEEMIGILNDEEKKRLMTERNYALGKMNFGYEATWVRMKDLLS